MEKDFDYSNFKVQEGLLEKMIAELRSMSDERVNSILMKYEKLGLLKSSVLDKRR